MTAVDLQILLDFFQLVRRAGKGNPIVIFFTTNLSTLVGVPKIERRVDLS